jgi:cyclopropane fatty-acyl-phospholipid synthase-like methyltransferase
MQPQIADNWYETFFQGINCEIWEKAIPAEYTSKEVDFIIGEMNLRPGAHVLDIPCGFGRHSVELAKRGFEVTGVDLSERFITTLKKHTKAEKLNIHPVHADILRFKTKKEFAGAVCLGNSFGYFEWKHMNTFIQKVASCLATGARFIINSGMVAESVIPNLLNYSNHKSYTIADIRMDVSNFYNFENSYVVSNLQYTKNGNVEEHAFKHYVFTIGEIHRMLQSAGFKTITSYGSIEKAHYKLGDQQVYIIAEKA